MTRRRASSSLSVGKPPPRKSWKTSSQNLVRVNDILSELARQLTPLEKQAETAKIYLKKRDELKVLDVNMFLLEMEESRTELAALRRKAGHFRAGFKGKQSEIREHPHRV